jgi:hypothetical protein
MDIAVVIMEARLKELEQLKQEIAIASAAAEVGERKWLSERDRAQKADLKEAWLLRRQDRDALIAVWERLLTHLTGTGVHTPLLAHNYSVSAAKHGMSRAVRRYS